MVWDKSYRCRSVVCSRDSKPRRNIEKCEKDIHACAVPKLERKPVAHGKTYNSNGNASRVCCVVSKLQKINTIRKEEIFKYKRSNRNETLAKNQ